MYAIVFQDVARCVVLYFLFLNLGRPPFLSQEYTRVWLLCEVKVSSVLPSFIVDYTAKRAMPRATTWLKPQVEAAATLWLKNMPTTNGAKKERGE